jgi:hypothetical protein
MKDVKEAAQLYIQNTWSVVPLVPKEKACRDHDWLKRSYKPEDFNQNDNIGIRSINGIVIIDCDSEEVVKMADTFLPKTRAIWGRKSRLRSKRMYTSTIDKMIAYKDYAADGGEVTLVEIRVNHQDMAPPSVHPNGELLTWSKPPVSATIIKADVLVRSVRLLATAAMIARYYNPEGDRHDWGLALAGFLKGLEVTEQEAVLLLEEAGQIANDHKVRDRLDAIRTTYAKGGDEGVTGAKVLEELMTKGIDFIRTLRKIWGYEQISLKAVQLLNLKHAVIWQQNGDVVLLTEEEGEPLRFSNLSAMSQVYNEKVVVGYTARGLPKLAKLGDVWLDSPKRRLYNGIELQPNKKQERPNYYNIWKDWPVKSVSGSWSLFRAHIKEVIADGDDYIEQYVLAWMAQAIQHPDRQGYTAIALQGDQGVGKSTFGEWFGSLFGEHFLEINSSIQLTGRFNAHFHNAIFVFADEAAWPGDRAGIGALRRMITQNTIAIERKGVDILTVKNHIHLMLASNAKWIVPAAAKERRFVVLRLSNKHRNDVDWFKAIHKELFEQGGREALLHDMLSWNSDINLRKIPDTKPLAEQKMFSFGYEEKWWYEKLCEGVLLSLEEADDFESFAWPPKIRYSDLHADYLEFTDKHFKNQRNPKSTQNQLGNFLKKFAPGQKQREMFRGKREIFRSMPTLEECREIWVLETGIQIDYGD